MYVGISKNGSLVAIHEWRFAVPVDRKGRPLETGSDILTTEGLIKHVNSECKNLWSSQIAIFIK